MEDLWNSTTANQTEISTSIGSSAGNINYETGFSLEDNFSLNICSLCDELLSETIVLNCLHFFHYSCLSQHVQKVANVLPVLNENHKFLDQIQCPKCSIPTAGNVDTLPKIRIEALLDEIKKSKETTLDSSEGSSSTDDSTETVKCGLCTERGDGVSKCEDCSAILCQSCEMVHCKMLMFARHTVIPLNENEKRQGKELEEKMKYSKPPNCMEHKHNTITFYCYTCQKTLCDDCLKINAHESHEKDSICSIGEDLPRRIKLSTEELNKCQNKITNEMDLYKSSIDEIQHSRDHNISFIKEVASDWRTAIDEVESFYLKRNKEIHDQAELKILTQMSDMHTIMDDICYSQKVMALILKSLYPIEIAQLSSHLYASLHNLCNKSLVCSHHNSSLLNFSSYAHSLKFFEKGDISKRICDNFGFFGSQSSNVNSGVPTSTVVPLNHNGLDSVNQLLDSLSNMHFNTVPNELQDGLNEYSPFGANLNNNLFHNGAELINDMRHSSGATSKSCNDNILQENFNSSVNPSNFSARRDFMDNSKQQVLRPPISNSNAQHGGPIMPPNRNIMSHDNAINHSAAQGYGNYNRPFPDFDANSGSPTAASVFNNRNYFSMNDQTPLPPHSGIDSPISMFSSHNPHQAAINGNHNGVTNNSILNGGGMNGGDLGNNFYTSDNQIMQPPSNTMAPNNPIGVFNAHQSNQFFATGTLAKPGIPGGYNPNPNPPFPNRSGRCTNITFRTRWGSLGSGHDQMNSPHGFCLGFEEEIIVADTQNHRILIFDKQGNFLNHFGVAGRDEGQLWYPRKVAVSRITNKYVVCDRGTERSRMQIFSRNGLFVRKIGVRFIDIVAAIAINEKGHLVAVDSVSPSVFIINDLGELDHWFDCGEYMREPSDLAVHKGLYYICDFKAHCVCIFEDAGRFIKRIGGEGITNFPNGIDISDDGDILVGDSHGNRFHVGVFDVEGNLRGEFECAHVKVSRCCGLKITSDGTLVTLAKNNNQVLVMETLYMT